MSRVLSRLRANKVAMGAGAYLITVVFIGVFAPLLAPHDEQLAARFQDILLPPSGEYLLGTDHVGRDLLSRVLFGARYALVAGVEAVAVALAIGVPLGMYIGYHRGWVDRVVMRLVETLASVPAIVMAMAIIAALGPGLTTAMLAIGLVFSMMVTRLTRAEVLAAREELYVDGALAAGAAERRVLWRHILPNVAPSLIVQATLLFAQAVLAEAALSFLGIGAASDQASWGRMLRDAQLGIDRTIWPAIPPGVALFLTVVAFNVFGDGIRDAFAREARGGRLGVGAVRPAVPATSLAATLGGVPAAPPRAEGEPREVLAVRGLSVAFPVPGRSEPVRVVDGVDLDIARGEVVALVGESGSGKSLTALSVLGLVPDPGAATAASIRIAGRELIGLAFDDLRRVRGTEVGVVFQEPQAALDPTVPVGRQVAEALRVHLGVSRQAARERVIELFADVGIPHPIARLGAYPHQFSGGMAQRVMLALALACDPQLLIADEPTTALDVTVQGQVLDVIRELGARRDLAVLLITHDLGVVADMADRVAVMYAGQVVESGTLDEVFARPRHPYTEGLIAAIPRNQARSGELATIPGVVPAPWDRPAHCHFADRCAYAEAACTSGPVELRHDRAGAVRCVRAGGLQLVGVRPSVRPAERGAVAVGGGRR
ncbi:MAG TPA: dipeptide/oligopeptide/nickel ABC transporter permease/ATP-binding protein [Ilumatobacter sp.]|nr:dipeptide/oligopeptide/nickel ABC transporter permease/ATP-binding protein [Ilumatobacter sp.]